MISSCNLSITGLCYKQWTSLQVNRSSGKLIFCNDKSSTCWYSDNINSLTEDHIDLCIKYCESLKYIILTGRLIYIHKGKWSDILYIYIYII